MRSPLVWIGLGVSIVALTLAFRGLHWGDVGGSVVGANYALLALAVAVLLLAFYARAIRWAVLFHPRTGLRLSHLYGAVSVGYALNNLLPLRVGELGRAYLICDTEQVSSGQALSTIVIERTLDTLTLVALLLVTLPFIDAPSWTRGPALLIVGLGFLALAVGLAVISAAQERTMALVRRLVRVLPEALAGRIERAAETGLQGFTVMRRPAVMAQAAAWSAASWLLSALVMYIVMQAFDLGLPFTAALFVMCATGLGMVVPSSPGYVGVFHAIAIESLVNVFSVKRNDAASFAFVQHAILYLTPIAVSIAYFIRERGAWRDVRRWASGASAPAVAERPQQDSPGASSSLQELARRVRPVVLRRAGLAGLALVLAMTVLARLIPDLMLGSEVADLSTYRAMALTVIREQDIYEVRNFFPYTPLSLFIPSFALHLSNVIDQPFHLVMKLFPMVGDVGTALLVFLLARRRWGDLRATVAGLAFAFNPLSILITGFHGNIMPLSVFFAFWAYYLLEAGERRRTYVLSALALGIGIGLRTWPILLLPFLLRPGVLEGWRQRIVYVSVAAFPSALTLAPYLLVNFDGINREFFHYTSTTDFGWVAIWRNLWFLHTGNRFLPGAESAELVSRSRTYFLIAYAVLAVAAFLRPRLLDTAAWIAFALVLFFTLFGGVAAQYLVWVVPFIALRPFGFVFSLVASGAIAAFYLTYHPGILLGPYPFPIEYSDTEIFRWYLGFLLALWAAGALWLLWMLMQSANQGVRYLVARRRHA